MHIWVEEYWLKLRLSKWFKKVTEFKWVIEASLSKTIKSHCYWKKDQRIITKIKFSPNSNRDEIKTSDGLLFKFIINQTQVSSRLLETSLTNNQNWVNFTFLLWWGQWFWLPIKFKLLILCACLKYWTHRDELLSAY